MYVELKMIEVLIDCRWIKYGFLRFPSENFILDFAAINLLNLMVQMELRQVAVGLVRETLDDGREAMLMEPLGTPI